MDNRNDQLQQQELQNQTANAANTQSSQQQNSGADGPNNRLKDGTNDFENGDQEPSSEASSKE